ncbi:TRAP transporter small permease [Ornithinimicrobium sufpigmenti]|uniref:TRAP transporter small permease n=1 Tax=Ornithinimicrobium sufpigmenti TaxID=2508882 RepID=UPI00103676D6|nr:MULTISPECIES: TRAP transporter small permease [unclassified Ornithinimicrobium]
MTTTHYRGPFATVHRAITGASLTVASVFLAVLTIVMVVEVVARYAVGEPLGWNLSLIEKVLLPGIVFLGLPWARSVGAHVSAGMVYERLSAGIQRFSRGLALVIEVVCYTLLLISGLVIAVAMFRIGAQPPPLSAQLGLPSWTWRAFLPLGAAGALVVTLIEIFGRVRDEETL